jgi:hypothetical protein
MDWPLNFHWGIFSKPAGTPEERLLQKREYLIKQVKRSQYLRVFYSLFAVLIAFISIFLFTFDYQWEKIFTFDNSLDNIDLPREMSLLFGIPYAIVVLAAGLFANTRILREELLSVDDELDLRSIPSESHEQKAQKLLRIQQTELSRYYDLVFRQAKGIFWVGVIALCFGFGVVIATLVYLGYDHRYRPGPPETNLLLEKGIVAVLGAVGAIMTNFIGAMYLKMFSEIIQSVNKSAASLTTTSNLHFANVLIANISDPAMRELALKELAVAQVNPSLTSAADNAYLSGSPPSNLQAIPPASRPMWGRFEQGR